MLNVAVVGATGYTGIELVKILNRHPFVRIVALTTRQRKSIPIKELIPTMPESTNLTVEPYSFQEIKKNADVVFLCLPHTEAAVTGEKFYRAGKIVIDLSADYRLESAQDYKKWYGVKHPVPRLLKRAVYGLPEIYKKEIQKANLIANPGCYPTASILSVAPLLKQKLVDPHSVIIDAKSGVSGAGKKLSSATHFCSVQENFSAYKVGRHQHTPEIKQTLEQVAGRKVALSFVTHLLPVERGILTTAYLEKKKGVKFESVVKAYQKAYADEPFVRVRQAGTVPCLKDVQGTNFCDIGCVEDSDSGRIIVVSAIDNLIKGASGQAVQNMNVRVDFLEDEGLNF